MLLPSRRYTRADLEAWEIHERADAARAARYPLAEMAERAMGEITAFWSGVGYAGVSWGKDSLVVAHLISRLHVERQITIPLVWIRVDGRENPDCPLVRDAFLAKHPCEYHEIETHATDGEPGKRTSAGGFALAAARFGARHISGVRGQESRVRRLRMLIHGVSSANTCAPIGWWTALHVFAYLHQHRLPVHPAYACSLGGLLEREHLRVSSLGGERGAGHGRRVWEAQYYPEEMRRLQVGPMPGLDRDR